MNCNHRLLLFISYLGWFIFICASMLPMTELMGLFMLIPILGLGISYILSYLAFPLFLIENILIQVNKIPKFNRKVKKYYFIVGILFYIAMMCFIIYNKINLFINR